MKRHRPILICAVLVLAAPAAALAATSVPPASHGHAGPGTLSLMRNLDLSTDQRTRVQAIHAALRPRAEALREATRRDRDALVSTAPNDPAYPALLEQSKEDAARAVQLRGDAWAQVYDVLTPEQRAKLPALVAEARQRRDSRRREWAPAGEIGPT